MVVGMRAVMHLLNLRGAARTQHSQGKREREREREGAVAVVVVVASSCKLRTHHITLFGISKRWAHINLHHTPSSHVNLGAHVDSMHILLLQQRVLQQAAGGGGR